MSLQTNHLWKNFIWTLLISALLSACVATPGKVSVTKPVPALNAPNGLGLHGFDVVSYFTDGKAVEGDPANRYTWRGITWQFASAEHRAMFISEPEHYLPQYGGYCAFAVSRGTTADGDPHQWAIVSDKLYVNNNAFAMQLWDKDRAGNINAADINWPLIPKQEVKSASPHTAY